jgi:hypothetical protein
VPEESFGAGVETMDEEFRVEGGKVLKIMPNGMNGTVMGGRGGREGGAGRGIGWEKEGLGVTQASVKHASDLNIINSTKVTVGGVDESARGTALGQSGSGVLGGSKEPVDRSR